MYTVTRANTFGFEKAFDFRLVGGTAEFCKIFVLVRLLKKLLVVDSGHVRVSGIVGRQSTALAANARGGHAEVRYFWGVAGCLSIGQYSAKIPLRVQADSLSSEAR